MWRRPSKFLNAASLKEQICHEENGPAGEISAVEGLTPAIPVQSQCNSTAIPKQFHCNSHAIPVQLHCNSSALYSNCSRKATTLSTDY